MSLDRPKRSIPLLQTDRIEITSEVLTLGRTILEIVSPHEKLDVWPRTKSGIKLFF